MVTLKTMLNQIKTTLLAQTWPSSANKIFPTGSVLITRSLPENMLRTTRVPACMIMPGNDQSDPEFGEEPDLLITQVIIRILVNVPGDAIGEKALIGANQPDATKSEGAGLEDILPQVYAAIGRLNVADNASFAIQFRRKGSAGAIHISDDVRWEYHDVEMEAIHTAN